MKILETKNIPEIPDLILNEGDIGVIYGGKEASAYLRFFMGVHPIPAGQLDILEFNFNAQTNMAEVDTSYRKKFGFAGRGSGLLSNMTLINNILLPARYHGIVTSKKEMDEFYQYWNLDVQEMEQRPSETSLRTRKLALLLRAVLHHPKLLLLDDPTVHLTWDDQQKLIPWIKKYTTGATIMASEEAPFVLALANWVYHCDKKQLSQQPMDFFNTHHKNASQILMETS